MMRASRNVTAGMLIGLLVSSAAGSRGQEPGSGTAAFELASIREDRSGEQEGFFRFSNGRFTVTSLPLRWIIRWAYDLREYQVSGLPNWSEARYVVHATYAPPSAGLEAIRAMTQRLLVDRFALRARREQRVMPLYQLVKVNDSGRLGPKMALSDVNCERLATQPPAPLAPGQVPASCTTWVNYGMVRGFSRTMPQLARALDDIVGAPVVDRTGLTGAWNLDVEWSVPTSNDARAELRTPPVESLTGLFAALQDQLGLKLAAVRGPVDVLVIDSISRPTPN